jgi:hypothetical protein
MSLSSFVKEPDVRDRLKPLRPDVSRKIPVPLSAPPRSGRYAMVGVAFDYLLRFEIERRADRCTSRGWVAEHAPQLLDEAAAGTVSLRVLVPGGGPPSTEPPPGGFRRAARRVQRRVDEARDVFLEYIFAEAPTGVERERAAACAIMLAKLDLVFRAGCYDTEFDHADPEDVADLLAMLSAAPFDLLAPAARIELNPVFGDASFAVGGADADIIAGDLLIDVKTSKQDRIQAEDLDQLLGYLLLARRARREQRRFPLVRRAGLYYARFAHPMILDAATWTGHPLFRETERWFFERARESAAEEPPEAASAPPHPPAIA